MKKTITLLLVSLFCSGQIQAQWQYTNGPANLEVYSLATNGNSILAGTSAGVHMHNGTNWSTCGLWNKVTSIVVSNSNFFAAEWIDSGVYLSNDTCSNWTAVINGLPFDPVDFWLAFMHALVLDGTDLYVGTDMGVYRTVNNGTNWTSAGLPNDDVRSLAISGGNIFAGTYGKGVFLSSDSGVTWNATNTGLTDTIIYSLIIDGANMFAGTNNGVFLSNNNGVNWTSANNGLSGDPVFAFAISGSVIYAGTGGGIFVSTDNGSNWTSENTGLTNTLIRSLTISGTDIYAGTDGGGVWVRPLSELAPQVNNAPIAVDDSASTLEDIAFVIKLLDNDSDSDGDTLSILALINLPANGVANVLNSDSISYDPNPDYYGTDLLTYSISDGNGGIDTASVVINVISVNDYPTALDDSVSTLEDNGVTMHLLSNDSDAEGDALTILAVITSPSNGTANVLNNDSIDYDPNPDYFGTDVLTYSISDGNGGVDTASVFINIISVNDAPIAMDDTASTVLNTSVAIDILGNDSDPDGGTLSTESITKVPANGTAVFLGGDSLNYIPDSGFTGYDTVRYTVTDGQGGKDTASVIIDVADKIGIGINYITRVDRLSVYPNPNGGEFTVGIWGQGMDEELELTITNIMGQEIISDQLDLDAGVFEMKLNLAKYGVGVYQLQVKTKQGILHQKIVVE